MFSLSGRRKHDDLDYADASRSSSPPDTKRPKKGHACLECEVVCKVPGDWNRHLESLVHKARSHVCATCGKKYMRRDALKRHQSNFDHT